MYKSLLVVEMKKISIERQFVLNNIYCVRGPTYDERFFRVGVDIICNIIRAEFVNDPIASGDSGRERERRISHHTSRTCNNERKRGERGHWVSQPKLEQRKMKEKTMSLYSKLSSVSNS